jgi:alpha-glucan,water dikinase
LSEDAELLIAIVGRPGADRQKSPKRLLLVSDLEGPLLLHWGLSRRGQNNWQQPSDDLRPAGTSVFDQNAVRSPFEERDGLRWLEIELKDPATLPGLSCVLFQPNIDRWHKHRGGNIFIPLGRRAARPQEPLSETEYEQLFETIIEAETKKSSWTLMHRFNLCHDMVEQVGVDQRGLSVLYCWLRYSALRQLDWQRRYNTKPRELAHSQDRLTRRLADLYQKAPAARSIVRLMMTTMGRGQSGQRVRDEILEIMHRHKIKEKTGHFMEEWHQKLHNNTTEDDIAICESYLAFLQSDGDVDVFYDALAARGVTKKRLASYERPIVTDPDFNPGLKEGLIASFEHYLLTLKRVHRGTDLQVAVEAAEGLLPEKLEVQLFSVLDWQKADATDLPLVTRKIISLREKLKTHLLEGDHPRDLLFLDIALENQLRQLLEAEDDTARSPGIDSLPQLVTLQTQALANVCLSMPDDELRRVRKQLEQLVEQMPDLAQRASSEQPSPRAVQDWALRVMAANERATRALGQYVDRLSELLGAASKRLGEAFDAEAWTIELFVEEVIRGRPPFALSAMLKRVDGPLRQLADLGAWQIISPKDVSGILRGCKQLRDVMAERFAEPTCLLAERVRGDEEIPEGVVGILTKSTVDIVSHVAVRARNAGVLFATCYDEQAFATLKGRAGERSGSRLALQCSPGGDVLVAGTPIATTETDRPAVADSAAQLLGQKQPFRRFAVPAEEFDPSLVGGKSLNLQKLRGKLGESTSLPPSLALPFGVFERVLEQPANREQAARYQRLEASLERAQTGQLGATLSELKEVIASLLPPPALEPALAAVMRQEGLAPPPFEEAFRCIKEVWASKWNERAVLSRRARGIPHDLLQMAVLIQPIVAADYAFVLHTVDPISRDPSKLFGEIVAGLGETLVGNYPGRALAFVGQKDGSEPPQVTAYPSKSEALRGDGLIFRSDSNGEDLAGYAGAGLYESIPLKAPQKVYVDYINEPLTNDRQFQQQLLSRLTAIGSEIEALLGEAQDIEGAVSSERYYVVQTRPQVGLDA